MSGTVKDIMTASVTTLSPGDDLLAADEIMSRAHVRHIPVIDDDRRLLGLITHRDLLRAQIEASNLDAGEGKRAVPLPASERMRHNVISASPDMSVKDAARTMLQGKLGCLPVVEDDKLVGIVTESDFVRWSLDALE